MCNGNSITDAEILSTRFSLPELEHELHMAVVNGRPEWDGYELEHPGE
jgi:hypothetical protein